MDEKSKRIADNMGLVYKQLHRFNMVYDDDAFSFAMEALMNAVNTYDANSKTAFSTYATVCIYNALGMHVRRQTKKRQLQLISYNEPIVDNDNTYTLEGRISSNDINPESIMILKENSTELATAFNSVASTLNATEASIIQYWKDSNFTASQVEIAKATGVSQAHVSRTLSAFRHKLKMKLEDLK